MFESRTYKRKRVYLAGADTDLRKALDVAVVLSERGFLPCLDASAGPHDAILCLGPVMQQIMTPVYGSLDTLFACEEGR